MKYPVSGSPDGFLVGYTEVMRSYIISLHICYYYLYQLYGTVQCTTCYATDNAQLVNKYADTDHSSECILTV